MMATFDFRITVRKQILAFLKPTPVIFAAKVGIFYRNAKQSQTFFSH